MNIGSQKEQTPLCNIPHIMESDINPSVVDTQIFAEERADGTILYSAIAIIKFRCLFGLISYRKKFFVHKIEFSNIYYLDHIKEHHYRFDDKVSANEKLEQCVVKWQKDYLRKRVIRTIRV